MSLGDLPAPVVPLAALMMMGWCLMRLWDSSGATASADLRDATARAEAFDGLRLIGTAPGKVAVISFLLDGSHPHDVGQLLDQQGVAVRTGHHCTMPLMDHLGIPGTVRASFSIYNDSTDIERLFHALEKVKTFL